MFKVNDKVRVHDPAWRDAAGHEYSPGKNHGKTGVVIEDTGYHAGNDYQYLVQFDDGAIYPHWGSELRS